MPAFLFIALVLEIVDEDILNFTHCYILSGSRTISGKLGQYNDYIRIGTWRH